MATTSARLTNEINSMREQKQRTENELDELVNRQGDSEAKMLEYRTQLQAAEEKLTQALERGADCEKQIKHLEDVLNSLSMEVQDAQSAAHQWQTYNLSLEQRHQELLDHVRTAEASVSHANGQQTKLREQLHVLTSELKDEQAALDHSRLERKLVEEDREQVMAEVMAEKSRVVKLQAERLALESESMRLQEEIEQAKRCRSEMHFQTTQAEEMVADAKQQIEYLAAESQSWQTTRQELQEAIQRLEREHGELMVKVHDLRTEEIQYRARTEEFEQLSQQIVDSKNTRDALNAEVAVIGETLTSLKNQIEETQQEMQVLERHYYEHDQKLTAQHFALHQQLLSETNRLSELKIAIHAGEGELRNQQEIMATKNSALGDEIKRLDAIREERSLAVEDALDHLQRIEQQIATMKQEQEELLDTNNRLRCELRDIEMQQLLKEGEALSAEQQLQGLLAQIHSLSQELTDLVAAKAEQSMQPDFLLAQETVQPVLLVNDRVDPPTGGLQSRREKEGVDQLLEGRSDWDIAHLATESTTMTDAQTRNRLPVPSKRDVWQEMFGK